MKTGAASHPKLIDLAELVKARLSEGSLGGAAIPFPMAKTIVVGIWELLLQYAAGYAHDGWLGRFSPSRIADAVGWPQDDAAYLIESMVKVRLLAYRTPGDSSTLYIKGWSDHAVDSVHAQLARARAHFYDGTAPKVRALKSEERDGAAAFYAQRDNRKPRSRGHKRGNTSVDQNGDGPHSVHSLKSGASPHLTSPHLTSPPTPPTPKPDQAPAPGPEGGGGGEISQADQNRSRAALRQKPWPDVSPAKANELARTHRPAAVLAAIRRGRDIRGRDGGDAKYTAGMLVGSIGAGDGEALAREGARAWWAKAPESERAKARAAYARDGPTLGLENDQQLAESDEFADYIADVLAKPKP